MKTTLAAALALMAALATSAQETAPANGAPGTSRPAAPAQPVGASVPARPQGQAAAPVPAATTDEIDLEELDDAALAAKRPQVTAKDAEGPVSLVDVDCDEATLADVLRQFRKTTGANIISTDSTNLQRRVSVTLRRVPWLQALTSILNSRGFRLDDRDGIFRVVEDRQVVPVVTQTFPLNHASAKELAELFNASYGVKGKDGKTVHKIASCFEGANVVVVTADEKTISDCARIVKEVDVAVPQIYIEARFLELSSQALHKLGMNWSSLSSWGVSARNIQFGGEINSGRLADYGISKEYTPKRMTQTGQTTSATESSSTYTDLADGSYGIGRSVVTPTTINAAEGAGRTAASMGWANALGFSGQLSADDFSLAMSAFEELGEGKVFSNPKVIVSNGKAARVDMTTKFPNVELTSQRGTVSSSTYTDFSAKIQEIPGDKDKGLFAGSAFYSWGIELVVQPRISPDGLISVEITPSISQLDTSDSEDGFYTIRGGATDSAYSKYPIINYKSISTDFTMKSGSTAVIGGLSRTVEDDVDSGIPYLRKIPWIGPKLFGWKSRQKVQKEIVIFVTLGIANPDNLPKDLGLPKNAVMGREYVNGTKLEPGDRSGPAAEALRIDLTPLDKRSEASAPATDAPKSSAPEASGSGDVLVRLSEET